MTSLVPYIEVSVDEQRGHFLLDFGATGSTIDLVAFAKRPRATKEKKYPDFDFFGTWGSVSLMAMDHSGIQAGVRQAGIIGTDFLSLNIFTFDYVRGRVYRASADGFCHDEALRGIGLRPFDTKGYYSNDLGQLRSTGTPNVPVVQVSIGGAQAPAQLDTGFGDTRFSYSINVNKAFFDAIDGDAAGLERVPSADAHLSTCVPGVQEEVLAYRSDAAFMVDADGNAVPLPTVYLFLKQSPPEIAKCGGIGVYADPAAQLGGSFAMNWGVFVVDPFSSRVWLPATLDAPRGIASSRAR